MKILLRALFLGMAVPASILSVCAGAPDAWASPAVFAPKVIVLTAFPPEWHAWTADPAYHYRTLSVKGLIRPLVCSRKKVCVTESGEGEINAAVTVAGLVEDPALDLRNTVFLRSGIAGGVDTRDSPLGSVYINSWVISWAFGHHYLTEGKKLSWAPPGCADYSRPGKCGEYRQNTLENLAYPADRKLLDVARKAGTGLVLDNSAGAVRLDRKFGTATTPVVRTGATVTGDDFWIGRENQAIARKIVRLYTHGKARYTNTAMEDLGDVAALARFGLASHYLSIRGISDIDVPPPGKTEEEIWKKGDLYAGRLAERNAVLVTRAVIRKLLEEQ